MTHGKKLSHVSQSWLAQGTKGKFMGYFPCNICNYPINWFQVTLNLHGIKNDF